MSSLTRDQLLVLLIEECSEVIKATTKCQRFGFNTNHGIKYGQNDIRLSQEVGDLLGVIDALMPALDENSVKIFRDKKITRAEEMLEKYGV